MKYTGAVLALALQAVAFPFVMNDVAEKIEKRQLGIPSTEVGRSLSADRTNCGVKPCLIFDPEDQFVSVTGPYAYASPAPDEIRGPCPGLNAAANHGYLPRSGEATIEDTISGLGAAFGLEPEACAFLSAYAIIFTGDPVAGKWSIGGPLQNNPLTAGIIGAGGGLSFSHNLYEGDSSIGRQDAYLNNGDAHSLDVERFKTAYETGLVDDRYTLDRFASHYAANANKSVQENPYYFAAPFSTTVVSPVAYNFVINLMSNRTADNPGGYLNGEMFKQFFAVTGDYPNFKWLPGQERIPENWYKRTSTNQYGLADIGGDLAVNILAYPDSFRLGGNVNGVNTYVGVDLADLTGGVYHALDLLDTSGTNSTCFLAELFQAILPNALNVALDELSAITDIVNDVVKPISGNLSCPAVTKYSQNLFNQFPGYQYSPTGPATNY